MEEITNINEIKNFFNSDSSFGIICHQNPDGDTLGAGFAMYHGLKQLGKECNVYCIDKPEKVFDMIDGIEAIKSVKEVKEKSIIFCDCSDETRAVFENDLKNYNVLNIDHHFSNKSFGNVNVVFADACAACQVVYHLLLGIGVTMDKKIAKCLYIGICTDTNNFTNSNVQSDIFFVAGELVKFGIEVNPITKALFKTKSLAKTKATAIFIDRIKMFLNDRLCVSYITLEDINKLNLDSTEGLVDVALSIEGVSVAVFLKEVESNSFKVSMRSNYDVDVCKICSAFGGGGHIKASGCRIDGELNQVITEISNEVSKWME